MRVLWFSNTPSLATKVYNKHLVGGSWIESLEYELMTNSNIELGIVFKKLAQKSEESTSEALGTKYFMVPRHPYRKFDRWFNRFTGGPLSEKSLKYYLEIIKKFKPDVILFFGTESDFPLIIPHIKVPSIIWFQGNLTVYNEMYENGILIKKTLPLERLKDIFMGDSLFHRYLKFRRLVVREKRIFSFAKNFIGRTDWDRRLVKIMSPQANYYHCDEPMRRPFMDNEWQFHNDRDRFIITTTISGNIYKGLETIFKTSQLLSSRLTKPFEWRVIGISEGTAYVKTARKLAEFNSLQSTVKLLGRKTGEELLKELMNADLYVHPSHIENSPNSVQEAMLLGMPVIATNVGGTPSLLIDGEEGLLVQSKDYYAMAGAIAEIFELPAKARTIGENARKRGLIRNDSKVICADLMAIFKELVNQPSQENFLNQG